MGSNFSSGSLNSLNLLSELTIEEQGVKKLEYGSARVVSSNCLLQTGIFAHAAIAARNCHSLFSIYFKASSS